MVWVIDYAQSVKGDLVSVVSESYPHLEKGAMLDFENIMKSQGYWDESRWNMTKHSYLFETGTKVEFFSVDTYGKARGPRRDVLFLNECNNLPWNIVDQLIIRTRKIVWMDWNPVEDFWFDTEMLPHRDDVDFITLTYKDNEALDETTVREIEGHKHDKMWWQVYGLGQKGEIETRIYKGWRIVDEIPHEARFENVGLDYGYTNDPTAIVDIYYYNGGYILDEAAYNKGLSNENISKILLVPPRKNEIVVPDAAEPKSNDELTAYGITVTPAQKGPGSVNRGIQFVQSRRISVTKRSLNILKEYRNYVWETDKDGKILNKPIGFLNHAMDAIRYGLSALNPADKEEEDTATSEFPKSIMGGESAASLPVDTNNPFHFDND